MAFNLPTSGSTDLYCMQEGNLQNGTGAIFLYRSSDSAGTIAGTTGYFKGQGKGSYGPIAGLQLGDIVLAIESTAGVTPGRVTLHGCISSTANWSSTGLVSTGGYDVSVQLAATT